MKDKDTDSGILYIGATPIGNVDDASKRLISTFQEVDLICAEDTRRTKQLLSRLEIKTEAEIISLYDHNEAEKADFVIEKLLSGYNVLQVSDAGMPVVSDPGYKLIGKAILAGIQVTCLPGPSAVLTALALSNLPSHRFCFEGFLPNKSGTKLNYLAKLKEEDRTMIFFESPYRIQKTISAMREVFGDSRKAAICRELTKTYEEVIRGSLLELVDILNTRTLKGEIVVVVEGASLK
ncbi:MAG: 16S rRNA (cytidine(1402)-2'-O)-methyltransferase [Candidatus Ancillula sp.]|nr:16S rRNA (cytidine(1402)-2'-O)-methyltransferase [Candidatus Ancillula sp.]